VIAVAQRLGRRGVGLDLNSDYLELARERTSQRGLLFNEATA
jgi:DNA modification methylase